MESIPLIGMGWAAGDNTGSYCESASLWDNIIPKRGPLRIKTETLGPYLPNTSMRLVDRQSQFLASSVKLAIGCLDGFEIPDSERTGISHGSYTAAVNEIIRYEGKGIEKGFNTVNPMEFPNTVSNVTVSRVGIWYRLKERVFALSEGVTSGLDAIGMACECLHSGKSDAFLACASEELPFWIQDDCGLTMFEGGISFMLCKLELALRNGYNVLGLVKEFESSNIGPGDSTGRRRAEYILSCVDKWELDLKETACFVSGCWNALALYNTLSKTGDDSDEVLSCYLHQRGSDQFWEGYTLNSMFDIVEALSSKRQNKKKNCIIAASDKIGLTSCLLLELKK